MAILLRPGRADPGAAHSDRRPPRGKENRSRFLVRRLLQQTPITVIDHGENDGATVEAQVIRLRLGVDAVGTDDATTGLEGIAQRLTELGRARLGLRERGGNGGLEQQETIITVAGKSVAAAGAERCLIAAVKIDRHGLDGMAVGQFFGDDQRTGGRDCTFYRNAAYLDELAVNGTVVVVDRTLETPFAQGDLRQRAAGARATHHDG